MGSWKCWCLSLDFARMDTKTPFLFLMVAADFFGEQGRGVFIIVIKPSPGVDPTKGLSPGFHGLTRVNSNQPGKFFKKIKVLVFYMKKLRENPCKYRLYIL